MHFFKSSPPFPMNRIRSYGSRCILNVCCQLKKWKYGFLSYAFGVGLLYGSNTWEVTEYIWNMGMVTGACSVKMHMSPIEYFSYEHLIDKNLYANIKMNDIVWVKSSWLSQFYREVLPNVKVSFVLVINDGDESFPSNNCMEFDVEDLINDPRLIHVFAQNCDYLGSNQKITPIPIGMDFHTIAYKGNAWGESSKSAQQQETELKLIIQGLLPTHVRKKRAFVDFQHANTMRANFNRYLQFGEDRADIFNQLLKTNLIDFSLAPMRRSNLWKKKGEYSFSISPHGNGLDCHRTWEDLVLGCIVIVKTSPLDQLYEGLPVAIVKDWSDINEENMTLWLSKYGDAFTNPHYRIKLSNAYWIHKIQSTLR
jgi:hypothetical protein